MEDLLTAKNKETGVSELNSGFLKDRILTVQIESKNSKPVV